MKKLRLNTCSLIAFVTLCSMSLNAQVTLPYATGFDDTNQKNGWTEYKKAATQFSHWTYAGVNAHSAPNCIGHDYSPSTGITLTDNWFVSPGFNIAGGGKLDSVWYAFSGFSMPAEGDTIALYLLNGSQDPAAAASKTLLFDFRDSLYQTDNTYRARTNITLPAKSGMSYLAIRYRNTDCSSKWLTAYFDNINISGGSVGLNNINKTEKKYLCLSKPGSRNIYSESFLTYRIDYSAKRNRTNSLSILSLRHRADSNRFIRQTKRPLYPNCKRGNCCTYKKNNNSLNLIIEFTGKHFQS